MNSLDSDNILEHYRSITDRIAAAVAKAGRRAEEITLLAVSKGQEAVAMRAFAEHLARRGSRAVFGESYVQEYRAKRPLLPPHRAHFIGRLQRNKAKELVALFDVIESVGSREAADAVNTAALRAKKLQDVYLQVNISDDPLKSGFAPDELLPFITESAEHLAALRICGLMTITRLYEDAEQVRPDFQRMAELHARLLADERCRARIAVPFQLSMGMSADFTVAIEEGATVVRVGTSLFGERAPG